MPNIFLTAPVVAIVCLLVAFGIYRYVAIQPNGNPTMQKIENMIRVGAMAFLKKEYSILGIFIIIVFSFLWLMVDRRFSDPIPWTAIAFVTGAICSMLAGFTGMQAATKGNSRTAEAANKHGQAKALSISFFAGSVMGLSVAGLGLLGVGLWFYFMGSNSAYTAHYISGFAMGVSSISLFARVGGGIYTKAADVGSDLVGKKIGRAHV